MDTDPSSRFYGELASWWPLISPVTDYAEEAAFVRRLLEDHVPAVHDVLELGSGGGHNAFFLKEGFQLTLTDLSAAMVAQSQTLNPDCMHLVGDMRTLRLERVFDAVFIHDAIGYMTSEADLLAALTTAFEHLRPGGVALVLPDATAEIFEPSEDVGGSDAPDRSVRFLEWTFDPDATDDWVQTEYVFALRRGDEGVRVVHETHRTGLFDRAAWLRLLRQAGFEAHRIIEPTTEDRPGRDVFVAVRPG
jgi:SAM-dependent methyltransferase